MSDARMPQGIPEPVFVDAFSGCGGLSLGLLRAGWRGLFAIEKDRFAFETLRANFLGPEARHKYDWPDWLPQKPHGVDEMLTTYRDRLEALRGKVVLLAGGPPCQGFSSAGRRKLADPRNTLVEKYLELVDLLQPRMVLLENVRGFTYDFKSHRLLGEEDVENFAAKLKARLETAYFVSTQVLRAEEFGVPQGRPRFFLIGFLRAAYPTGAPGEPFDALRQVRDDVLRENGITQTTSAADALSDLEVGRNGRVPCPDCPGYEAIGYKGPLTAFQRAMRDGFDGTPSDTRLAKHRPHIVDRFGKIILACKEAGRSNVQLSQEMRDKFGMKKMATRVLDPVRPAPTITSLPDDLLHYREPRTLTVRENARLQTFPDWFVFKGKYTTGGDRRTREVPRFTQVANAVPPLLAEMLGTTLLPFSAVACKLPVAA